MYPLLIIITIILSSSLHSMENNEFNPYLTYVTTTQKILEQDKNDFLDMIYNKQLDPQQEFARIEQQFTYRKNKLINEEKKQLSILQKAYNINDFDWAKGMKKIENNKQFIINSLNTIDTYKNDAQDPIISGKNKIFFTNQLKKYGLDIQKIVIKKGIKNKGDKIPFCISWINEDKKQKPYIFPKQIFIEIDPLITKISSAQQQGNLATIAWRIGNLCITGLLLADFIARKSSEPYDLSPILENPNYISLKELYSTTFAFLYPCFNDYKTCQYIEALKSISTTSSNLTREQTTFLEICTLKNLWEKQKALKKIIKNESL